MLSPLLINWFPCWPYWIDAYWHTVRMHRFVYFKYSYHPYALFDLWHSFFMCICKHIYSATNNHVRPTNVAPNFCCYKTDCHLMIAIIARHHQPGVIVVCFGLLLHFFVTPSSYHHHILSMHFQTLLKVVAHLFCTSTQCSKILLRNILQSHLKNCNHS